MNKEQVIEKLREAKSSVDPRGTNAKPILLLIDAFVGGMHVGAIDPPEAPEPEPEAVDEFDLDSLKPVYDAPKAKAAKKR